jgi:TPR repeat protein
MEKDDRLAAQCYVEAAELEDPTGLVRLAECCRHGIGLEKDLPRAVDCYRRAAAAGDPTGQFEYACHLFGGDQAAAADFFRRAADGGHLEACVRFGDCALDGIGRAPNPAIATEYFEKAAQREYPPAIDRLGLLLQADDPSRAFACFRQAARFNYAPAQVHLGSCYENGVGCAPDFAMAARNYKKAAEKEDQEGLFHFGQCLRTGRGVDMDQPRAVGYLMEAAERGHTGAMVALGDCFRLGHGVKTDGKAAYATYRKAAELGDAAAIFSCGNCHRHGIGATPDLERARQCYRVAAARHHPEAMLAYRHSLEIRSREALERDLAEWIMDFSKFKKVRSLGRGTYGNVTLMKNGDRQYAVKDFLASGEAAADISISFLREVDALIRLSHPCVLQIRGIALPGSTSGGQIATDFMEKGSIEDILGQLRAGRRLDFWTHTRIALVIAGIVLGMRHIHRLGFMHRDLKPGNLLLDSEFNLRIADMGTCKLSVGSTVQTVMVGTPLYSAPDVYKDEEYTESVDVYSFTLIWYELVTGDRAFSAKLSFEQITRQVLDGVRPQVPTVMHSRLGELMTSCWSQVSGDRKSFHEIFQTFRRAKWKLFPDVNTKVVETYVEGIERWEKEMEEKPEDGVCS